MPGFSAGAIFVLTHGKADEDSYLFEPRQNRGERDCTPKPRPVLNLALRNESLDRIDADERNRPPTEAAILLERRQVKCLAWPWLTGRKRRRKAEAMEAKVAD